MTTPTRQRVPVRARWWRRVLAAAAAVLATLLGAGTASATTVPDLQTRVRPSSPVVVHVAGVHESITAGQRWGNAPPQAGVVVATGVAAKGVDNLPTVHWGQQSKHFPGHPNYIPGKGKLTANPEALMERAGTGTPVGSVPRGQPGFKERIDFGDRIGTYISKDGTSSSPTSVGILHYRADGSLHIIPGRP